jgi:uncharacterized membrane protein
MALLIFGLLLFFGTHLSPGVFGLRPLLTSKLGEKAFSGIYIAMSVTGMLCLIGGKAIAPYSGLYHPPLWGKPLTPALMAAACILLAALFVPTNLKRLTRHPMLWGIALWSTAHLLANGDLASVLVFGGFGSYALLSMWSLNKRGAKLSTTPRSPVNDLLLVIIGLAICAAIVWLHPYLFGVPAILGPLPQFGGAM